MSGAALTMPAITALKMYCANNFFAFARKNARTREQRRSRMTDEIALYVSSDHPAAAIRMRLPKRTPSSRQDELRELYARLYPTEIDEFQARNNRVNGVKLCHVWLNRGACPHAVESTMAFVEAQLLDQDLSTGNAAILSHAEWPIRSAYSMAIIRFVNSVADSMQQGVFAQSIFGIAERIGLPLHFVELRHAATHEGMPSLQVLRQASIDALYWLQHNFWLPNIASSRHIDDNNALVDSSVVDVFFADIQGEFEEFESNVCEMTRDISLQKKLTKDNQNLLTEIVRRSRSARASLAIEKISPAEAVSEVISQMITQSNDMNEALESAWKDALRFLHNKLPGVIPCLLRDLLEMTADDEQSIYAEKWLIFLLNRNTANFELDEETLHKAIMQCLQLQNQASLEVARVVITADVDLLEKYESLLKVAEQGLGQKQQEQHNADVGNAATTLGDIEETVSSMEERLKQLKEQQRETDRKEHHLNSDETRAKMELCAATKQKLLCDILPGWSIATRDEFPRSTPMGCIQGNVPHLVLQD